MVQAPFISLPARRAGTVFAWVLGLLAIASVVGLAWVGIRGASAVAHLEQARGQISQAVAKLADPAAAQENITSARDHTASAAELTSDPVWAVAEHLPWLGPQLAAVSAISAASDDVAGATLSSLAEVGPSFSLDSFRVAGGSVDIATISALAEPAQRLAQGLNVASAKLDGIDRAPLVRPVRVGLDDAAAQLSNSAAAASTLERATALLPAMLGGNETRTWLALFQNPAELRSLGGMPGATAVISADGGRVELVGQGTANIPRFAEPVLPLDPEVLALYQRRPGVWFSGTTLIPDFAVAAPLAREMWQRAHGVAADGVLSIDPIAMSYVLEATGPVTLENGQALSADNAVSYLLNQVYLDYPDSDEQNEVFADAAARVFSAITAGQGDPATLISALGRATEERRLLVWSADADEQAILAGASLAGALPRTDDEAARFGLYLNDGTGSKLGYYLNVDPQLEWIGCAGGGPSTATLTVRLRNDAPAGAATSLPPAIAGGNYGVPAAVLRVVGYIYLPLGSTLVGAEVTHAPGFGGGVHEGHRVLSFQTDLAPGESSAATVTVELDGAAPENLVADLTPAFGSTSVAVTCEAQ